jgi:arylsulfotransferase ASST
MPVALWRGPGRKIIVGAGLLSACISGPDDRPPPATLAIDQASLTAGPFNVLSAVVTLRLRGADSAAVRYGVAGGPLDSLTPAVPVAGDSVGLPVFGLLPATTYQVRGVAWASEGEVEGPALSLATGPLPPDLPVYQAGGTDPSPGYVVLAAPFYGVVIDNTGRVVWYRNLSGGSTLNFEAEPTGKYVTQPTAPGPTDSLPWVEFDPLGNEVRRLGCVRGLRSRFHDLIEEPDGSYWIMCDETRTMDLSSLGGVAGAQVTGTVIQHVRGDRTLAFEWDPFDHFAITDLELASRTGPLVNWTHGNALDLDPDGSLLVSFRSLSEITKIDTTTGAVAWRLGGLRNQFTTPGGASPFTRQHGLRLTRQGRLTLLDNLGEPGGSRAEEWTLDEGQHVATMTASYVGFPAVTALLGGSTQRLPLGRTLVAYGNGGRVQEYDALGNVVWEIHGNPGYVFRAQRIVSLYHPGVGTAR